MAATHTTNLNLNKPDRQDLVSVITDINDNMDIIDNAYDSLSDQIANESVALTNTSGVNAYTFRKQGKLRFLYMELIGWSLTDDDVVGVIPSGDRPAAQMRMIAPIVNSTVSSQGGFVFVTVNTNGNITVKTINGTSSRFTTVQFQWSVS